jgi:hypothetical protein
VGTPRMHGELLKLGITVSRTTVAKYRLRRPDPPSPTWRTFLRHQGSALMAGACYAALLDGWCAVYVTIIAALRRGVAQCVVGGWQRLAGRDAISLTTRCDTMFMTERWAADLVDVVNVPERDPPSCQSLLPDHFSVTDLPMWGRPRCVWPWRRRRVGVCLSCSGSVYKFQLRPGGEAPHGEPQPDDTAG